MKEPVSFACHVRLSVSLALQPVNVIDNASVVKLFGEYRSRKATWTQILCLEIFPIKVEARTFWMLLSASKSSFYSLKFLFCFSPVVFNACLSSELVFAHMTTVSANFQNVALDIRNRAVSVLNPKPSVVVRHVLMTQRRSKTHSAFWIKDIVLFQLRPQSVKE
jgi:hypothetical protein